MQKSVPWSPLSIPQAAAAILSRAESGARSVGFSRAQEFVAALASFATDPIYFRLEVVREYFMDHAEDLASSYNQASAHLSASDGKLSAGLQRQLTASVAVAASEEQEEDFPWHNPALPFEMRQGLAENRPLERQMMAAMAQLDCGACGSCCQTYSEAIAQGEETDLTKCLPGGRETARKLKELVASRKSLPKAPANGSRPSNSMAIASGTSGSATKVGSNGSPSVQHDRKNPFPAPLLQCKSLTQPGSSKDVRFIAFSLNGSGLGFEVGDALGLMPENGPELVEAILRSMGARGDELVPAPGGQQVHSFDALSKHYVITKVSDALAALLAAHASDPLEAVTLKTLVDDNVEGIPAGWDVLDLLDQFPSARAPVPEMIATLSPLQPRLYSISSSLKTHPNEVHLTVGVVRYTQGSRVRKGVASNFLSETLKTRQKAGVFIHASPGFRLPADIDAPVIMVGPGTGIAPFRAFLEDRAAIGAKGKNWLLFGGQHRAYDFLYEDELEGFSKRGVLTRLDTAFSRDQERKIYVQDRMCERARDLWHWVQDGAYLYVCGDAKRMASDVDRALHQIVAEQGGLSTEEAKNYVAVMTKTGRYRRDVY